MIQDAHPLRSGSPDGYMVLYKIECLAPTGPWNIVTERMPSGFSGTSATSFNVRAATGLGLIRFPPGFRVRGAKGSFSAPDNAIANMRNVFVTDVDEVAGTAAIGLAANNGAAFADPPAPTAAPAPNDSIIFVELDLETV